MSAFPFASSPDTGLSAFREAPIKTGACNGNRWKYGDTNPWNKAIIPTSATQRGGTFNVTFALHDRGVMTDGYRIYIEAQDFQGNYNGVEKEGKLEKSFAQKVWDTVSGWLNVVGAIVRAFIAWIVETAGPLIGFLFGLIYSIARSIVDMIFGLFDLINMLVCHANELIESSGAMFSHIGEVFKAMVDQILNQAEWALPPQ